MKHLMSIKVVILLSTLLLAACNANEGTTKITSAKQSPPSIDYPELISTLKNLKSCPVLDQSIYPKPDNQAVDIYNQAIEQSANGLITATQEMEGYIKAAQKGYWPAMYNLGVIYHQGFEGLPSDPQKALYWFRKVEKLNIPEGFEGMSLVYERGINVSPDNNIALSYIMKAALMGSESAQYYLGYKIFNKIDQVKEWKPYALKMWECAANQGYSHANWMLGTVAKQDEQYSLAYRWFRQGAKLGDRGCLLALVDSYNHSDKDWVKMNLQVDKKRANCIDKLDSLLKDNPNLTFPDLDQRCPPNVAQPNVDDDPFPPK